MVSENERVVREFCAAWGRKDVRELCGFFAEHAVYHNIPMGPVTGKAAIAQAIGMFLPGAETIEFEMVHLAAAGDVVFTERMDRFVIAGRDLELPVAGVFELENGLIKAWRDYFDIGMWQRQASGN